jgi:hypothetical protein
MTTVHILMKHPPSPFDRSYHLESGVIHGVFLDKKQAKAIADEKNALKPYGLYVVHTKRVKP